MGGGSEQLVRGGAEQVNAMGKIEWAMWANEQALASGLILLTGGIVGVAGQFRAGSLLLMLLSQKQKGQGYKCGENGPVLLHCVCKAFGPLTRNYYVRAFLHAAICVPGGFMLATVLGCVCLGIASLIYLAAAIHGEHWEPILPRKEVRKPADSMKNPPQNPPPRPPPEMRRKRTDDLEGAAYDNPMKVTDE
ncbi:hypothetical protein INR49_012228 [Caranx melampygus]|nr:hypothetical protein INR49_012228 [Caranx melampygus]